jgi:hypothetical protein
LVFGVLESLKWTFPDFHAFLAFVGNRMGVGVKLFRNSSAIVPSHIPHFISMFHISGILGLVSYLVNGILVRFKAVHTHPHMVISILSFPEDSSTIPLQCPSIPYLPISSSLLPLLSLPTKPLYYSKPPHR